jgi:hypothetical protein
MLKWMLLWLVVLTVCTVGPLWLYTAVWPAPSPTMAGLLFSGLLLVGVVPVALLGGAMPGKSGEQPVVYGALLAVLTLFAGVPSTILALGPARIALAEPVAVVERPDELNQSHEGLYSEVSSAVLRTDLEYPFSFTIQSARRTGNVTTFNAVLAPVVDSSWTPDQPVNVWAMQRWSDRNERPAWTVSLEPHPQQLCLEQIIEDQRPLVYAGDAAESLGLLMAAEPRTVYLHPECESLRASKELLQARVWTALLALLGSIACWIAFSAARAGVRARRELLAEAES